MIFTKSQVVSEYICRRLYRYFIYYDIDSTIESNIIIPLARTFVANNWEIEPVLNQLFKSQHFMIWPIEVFISNPLLIWSLVVCVLLTWTIRLQTQLILQYRVWNYFNNNVLTGLEQTMGIFQMFPVGLLFYQNPSFHEYWINSSTTKKDSIS
jgi:hypothetical protein